MDKTRTKEAFEPRGETGDVEHLIFADVPEIKSYSILSQSIAIEKVFSEAFVRHNGSMGPKESGQPDSTTR
ncbi:hypothetical protein SLS58_006127 [Diplodia intermedia]|uniref:Uncharacterized protein n=1 Tax=Diplodia intermedia TaxID=856260 RepID=A0ABR3TP96_9PEZI